MATAKLWWNGSSWSASETTCVDSCPGSAKNSWARVRYTVTLIAYDDATLQMVTTLKATSAYGSPWISGGTKTMKSGSTTIGTGAFTADVTAYSSFSWSGNVSCAMNEYGSLTYHAGTQNSDSGTIDISNDSPFRTITFNANGGSGAPASWNTTVGSVTLPATIPTRTGYSFLGWSESSSATSASYSAGGSYPLSDDVTLYAVWQANSFNLSITKPASATVTILKNGTAFTGSTINYDDVLTITATPTPGYRITALTLNGSAFVSGSVHTVTGDVAIVVTTIAQSSTIATYDSAVLTLGTFTLTANRYSTSHYNKLRYYDSNNNLLHTSAVFTDSTSITVPQSWFTNFPSVTSITVKAVLTTYTEPECINVTGVDDICYFAVTADDSMKPVLASGACTIFPYNTTPGAGALTNPGYIKGFSKVQAAFDTTKITHSPGASVSSYSVTVQNTETSGSSATVVSSNILSSSGSLTITYKVTDSRGRSTTGTVTISVSDYTAPAIASLNCFRCDVGGTENENAAYMAVTATCTFTAISDNAITINVQVKPVGGSYTDYGSITNATEAIIGGTFLPDTSYFVKVTVTDTVGNSAYTEMSMPRRTWDFHVIHTANGAGAAFGKVAETENVLQLASGWSLKIGSTTLSEADLIRLLALLS